MWALACLACAVFCTVSGDTDEFHGLLANISESKHLPPTVASPPVASAPAGQLTGDRTPTGQPTNPSSTATPFAPDSSTGILPSYNIRDIFLF